MKQIPDYEKMKTEAMDEITRFISSNPMEKFNKYIPATTVEDMGVAMDISKELKEQGWKVSIKAANQAHGSSLVCVYGIYLKI